MQSAAFASLSESHAIRIYLKASADVLVRRIASDDHSKAQRPSLTGAGSLKEVQTILLEREPTYIALAHHVFETDDLTLETSEAAVSDLIRLAGL